MIVFFTILNNFYIQQLHLKTLLIIPYNMITYFILRGIYMITNEINKDELILKMDFSCLETVDKFIDFLKTNNIDVKGIGRDEYLIKI